MWWLWVILACAFGPTDGLSADGRAARDALAQVLVDRKVSEVAAAAQAASEWEGKNPALDRLLGDALANVLMRPEQGLDLLEARPAIGDPAWESALLNAAMRHGQTARITRIRAQLGRPALDYDHPVVRQVSLRALANPSLTHVAMNEALQNCRLLDGQPRVGRRALDLPAPSTILSAARALGATRVVVGRAVRRTDTDPGSGRGPLHCKSGVLMPPEWPDPMLRSMTIGATDGDTRLYLNVNVQNEGPWVFAASDADAGARWVNAAIMLGDLGDAPDAVQRVQTRFGTGLRGAR